MDIAARVKLPSFPDDLLLELLGVHGALLGSLNKQGRRSSAVANNNTLENKVATGGTDVVFDRPELANDKRPRIMELGDNMDLLGVTPETVLTLDPIIFSTLRNVLSDSGFEEEVASVEVTVRVPQRDIRAITRLGQDHELQESVSRALIGGGGCRRFVVGLNREETVRRSLERDQQMRVLTLSANRDQHSADFGASEQVL